MVGVAGEYVNNIICVLTENSCNPLILQVLREISTFFMNYSGEFILTRVLIFTLRYCILIKK